VCSHPRDRGHVRPPQVLAEGIVPLSTTPRWAPTVDWPGRSSSATGRLRLYRPLRPSGSTPMWCLPNWAIAVGDRFAARLWGGVVGDMRRRRSADRPPPKSTVARSHVNQRSFVNDALGYLSDRARRAVVARGRFGRRMASRRRPAVVVIDAQRYMVGESGTTPLGHRAAARSAVKPWGRSPASYVRPKRAGSVFSSRALSSTRRVPTSASTASSATCCKAHTVPGRHSRRAAVPDLLPGPTTSFSSRRSPVASTARRCSATCSTGKSTP